MSGRHPQPVVYPWRLGLVAALLLLLFAAVLGRVLYLQVLELDGGRAFLQREGAARAVRSADIPAYRGLITDRRGDPLAVSTPVISLFADPARLAEAADLAPLAEALAMPLTALEARLERYADKRFMYLRRHAVPAEARRILALRMPGVRGAREYRRFYPAGEVAAQLVGFTNTDGEGIAGLELAYDDWLRGIPGRKRYIKDMKGEAIRDIGVIAEARPGRDLRLSIDLRLQYLQHAELQRAVALTGARAGSVVTLDSHSGEVLAIVNHPVYNPNNRESLDPASTRNRALTDEFEPGSTVKPLTLVAALESGRYTPDTIVDTSPGRIRVGRKVLPDPRNYGELTLARVIAKSSQVGVTKVALDLGREPVWNTFQRFGLGAPLGTGFPGESAGRLPDRPRWRPIEEVTLAFGYGLTATPLQLARAYSVFASGGVLPEVSLLHRAPGEAPGRRILQPETAAAVRRVLQGVTADDATGHRARVAGYEVGGKTGTVHKVGAGGYLDDQYIALFAGLAPVEAPRFVTVVVLDRPQGDHYGGGAAAAPVFARVAEGALRLLNVPPAAAASGAALAALESGP